MVNITSIHVSDTDIKINRETAFYGEISSCDCVVVI